MDWTCHFLISIDGKHILTDPVFSDRASPSQLVGPKRATPPACAIKDLPPIDYVVLSYDHYDHLDENSVLELNERFKPQFILPLKYGVWFDKRGIHNWIELD